MSVQIRPARQDDALSIADISLRGWEAAYADILPRETLEERDATLVCNHWRDYVAAIPKEEGLIVAEKDGRVSGFARFGPCSDDDVIRAGEVYGLYVTPELTGVGIGTRLFEGATSRLAMEFGVVVVWTFAANTDAIRFYERAGLVCDGAERLEEDTQVPEEVVADRQAHGCAHRVFVATPSPRGFSAEKTPRQNRRRSNQPTRPLVVKVESLRSCDSSCNQRECCPDPGQICALVGERETVIDRGAVIVPRPKVEPWDASFGVRANVRVH
jgi:GNAT superfamily N-acetyltransferase